MGDKDIKFDYVGLWISHGDNGHFGIILPEQKSGELEGICLDKMGSAAIRRFSVTPQTIRFVKCYDGRHNVVIVEAEKGRVWVPSPGIIIYEGSMQKEFKASAGQKLRDISSYVGEYETMLHRGRFIMQSSETLMPALREELNHYVEMFGIPEYKHKSSDFPRSQLN